MTNFNAFNAANTIASNSVSFAQVGAEGPGAVMGGGVYLSPEEFFAIAQQQLGEADSQIRGLMTGIQQSRYLAGRLSQIAALLRSAKGLPHDKQVEIVKEAKAMAESAGLGATTKKLADFLDGTMVEAGKDDGDASHEVIENMAQAVDADANELTSGVDIGMIKLQSLMQQRSQILTLASNVIAALNDPMKNAISNIRGS